LTLRAALMGRNASQFTGSPQIIALFPHTKFWRVRATSSCSTASEQPSRARAFVAFVAACSESSRQGHFTAGQLKKRMCGAAGSQRGPIESTNQPLPTR